MNLCKCQNFHALWLVALTEMNINLAMLHVLFINPFPISSSPLNWEINFRNKFLNKEDQSAGQKKRRLLF